MIAIIPTKFKVSQASQMIQQGTFFLIRYIFSWAQALNSAYKSMFLHALEEQITDMPMHE
jgi:hypothetical protein